MDLVQFSVSVLSLVQSSLASILVPQSSITQSSITQSSVPQCSVTQSSGHRGTTCCTRVRYYMQATWAPTQVIKPTLLPVLLPPFSAQKGRPPFFGPPILIDFPNESLSSFPTHSSGYVRR